MGIEPTYPAWKAGVLPLNYTRISVGVTGFEPATSWSQTRRSSQAEPHPDSIVSPIHSKLHTDSEFSWSSLRPISNSQLHTLLCFHPCPIYLVVFKGSYPLMWGISHLEGGFSLRCLQRLSLPDLATLPCRWPTADTPVVRPSRSSRTKDSSSQISSARAG